MYYDYVLTFSSEVQFIWRRKWSAATVLFVMNRYAILLYQTLNLQVQFTTFGQMNEAQADLVYVTFFRTCMKWLTTHSCRSQNVEPF